MKLLIVSDIHGNWPAMESVLHAEPNCSAVAFCGDVVDYGPFPVECIDWLDERADYLVRGNHDNALAFDLDCRCMGSFREFSLATRAWHGTLVDEDRRDFLRQFPTIDSFDWYGRRFLMAHATPQGDMYEYLPQAQWGERVTDIDVEYVLLGHTHVQGMQSLGKTTVVNPGSVGLARDGAGEACYAVFDGETMALKPVPYDVERTIAGLRDSPLPKHVIEGLSMVLRKTSRA